MDPLWYEFRSSPATFLVNNRTNVESLVHDLLQIVFSDDKSITLRLNVLGIFQECVSFLLDDLNRLELVLVTLKKIFDQQKTSGDPLFTSQILVTLTVVLIQSDFLENVQPFLLEFITFLLEIIEKVKTENNRLLRATACECLREVELAIPGILCDIVGHLYGMSQAENSFIHQHYMALFSTVLSHCVQKVALLSNESSTAPPDDDNGLSASLHDLLFYSGKLPAFEPPTKYWKISKMIGALPMFYSNKVSESKDQSELKKAVVYLVDHSHLFTTHYIVQVVLQIMKIISCSSLSPVMLKSLLLRYTSSLDIQLCHLVLLLKLLFTDGICDERDEETILRRLITIGGHPSLPTYQCTLAIQWLLQLNGDQMSLPSFVGGPMTYTPLVPLIFDSAEIVWFKILALTQKYQGNKLEDNAHDDFRSILASLQKPVLYGVSGSICHLLYRTMLLFCEQFEDKMKEDVERAAVDILTAHAEFTPQSIDLMTLLDKKLQDSSMSGKILSELCQWLLSLEITALCTHLEHHLSLCIVAAKSKHVRPQIPLQILKRLVTESTVCQQGDWIIGNAVLSVCCTLMRTLPSNGATKDLANLLLNISKNFRDIDVRDRARIYLQILLTVSSEKLTVLLSEAEIGSDLSQVVVARISNDVYPLPPPIKVIPTAALSLTRSHYVHHKWSSTTTLFAPKEKVSSAMQYLQWLKEHRNMFGLHIPCDITLSHDKPDCISDKVFAIVLQISTSGPYIKPNDMQIPSLSLGEEVQMTFYIEPIKPFPASFHLRAIFTTEEGETCNCPLNEIDLQFDELFHSLPVDTNEISKSTLFDLLWNYIENEQYSRSCPDKEGALSVMRLPIDNDTLQELITSSLSQYCVQDTSQDLLLFLPPQYHILLKFISNESSTVTRIATDNWKLLPFIGEWLKQVSQ